MPVGHPKDPVAHAALLAAKREKRAAERNGQPVVKRAYRKKVAVVQKGSGRQASIDVDELVKDLQEQLKASRDQVVELQDQLVLLQERCTMADSDAEKYLDLANNTRGYLFAVLDLVANQK